MQPVVFVSAALTTLAGLLFMVFCRTIGRKMESVLVAVLPEFVIVKIRAGLDGLPLSALLVGLLFVVIGVLGVHAGFVVS